MKKICLSLFFGILLFNGGIILNTAAADDPCEQGRFNSDCLFPTWKSEEAPEQVKDAVVQGVIGSNQDGGFLMTYIPHVIDILLKFVAPIVTLMLVWTGILFIIAGSDEEDISKAKNFFTYALIGVGFIILSYSILKTVYFLIAHG